MDKVLFYDIIFLVLFTISISIFLYSRKTGLIREGWMYLYKTKWGMKYIDEFSKKHSKLLFKLKYPILINGFILMALMIALLCQTVYTYIKFPQISSIIKAPPVMPLIPYFTQIFKVENFMPPFYFSYFIIALVIVAVVHEFSHGIFMRLYKIKIKSTGFAFLGPIFGAFVEQDQKSFDSKKNSEQMVVLGAGVFANIITSLLFFIILVMFFSLSYSPAGYNFNSYAYGQVNINDITNYSDIENNFTIVNTNKINFIYPGNSTEFADKLSKTSSQNIILYYDAPAVKNNLPGTITNINGEKIISEESLSNFLKTKSPGENILITTINNNERIVNNVTLTVNPSDENKAFLGIATYPTNKNILGRIVGVFTKFKNPSVYYESKYNKEFSKFTYDLIWWIVMINLFVGLFNMLPLGILDGGRFFYLAILSITKNKKAAEKSFKYATKIILLIFLAMIFAWLFSLF